MQDWSLQLFVLHMGQSKFAGLRPPLAALFTYIQGEVFVLSFRPVDVL